MSEIRLTEVIPGIHHWSAPHPDHGHVSHSYLLTEQHAALDPIGADGLLPELERLGGVEQVLLSNRLHLRGSEEVAERFGAAIRVPAAGLHRFDGPDEPEVIAYDWGDEVMPGVTSHEVGSISPDDGAFHIAIGPGALALADSVMADESGLGFVPDGLMDDPERTKEGIVASLRRLIDLKWDALLLAHGGPLPSAGKEALASFVESPRSISFD